MPKSREVGVRLRKSGGFSLRLLYVFNRRSRAVNSNIDYGFTNQIFFLDSLFS
jgi:hypothetical protein